MKSGIRATCIFYLIAVVAMSGVAFADVPTADNVMVTDVTTVSFSVIWSASEASAAGLQVFDDQDGIVPSAGVTITPHPIDSGDASIKSAAEDNGVMKVKVTGLSSNTTYYFKTVTTSKSSAETAHYPSAAPYLPVTTQIVTDRTYEDGDDLRPFSNDVIIQECWLEDGTTAALGTLLVATIEGSEYPITAFVGDGVDPPYALIDLNNVYSRDNYENLEVDQGNNLTLVNYRGLLGNSIVVHETPENRYLCEIKTPAPALISGRNMVSLQLEPGATDVESVLDPIFDHVSSIWAFDSQNNQWVFYVKEGLPFLNDLTELHSGLGVLLYMENEASWQIHGSFDEAPIPLKAGRNLTGFRSIHTLPVYDAIESIYDDLISIWHYDSNQNKWIFYVKDGLPFLNELEVIEPGKAYWVYVGNDCQW